MRRLHLRVSRNLATGRGGGAFDIASIPDLAVYLKHTTGTYQDDAMTIPAAAGDPVGGWRDQVGGDWNPTAATTDRPTLQSGGLSFVSGAAGVGNLLTPPNWSGLAAFTYVFRYSKTITKQAVFHAVAGGGSNVRFTDADTFYFQTVDDVANHTSSVDLTDDGNFHTIIARKSLTAKNIRFDGTQVVDATGLTLGTTFTSPMSRIGYYTSRQSDMLLKYWLLITRYITDAEAANIESFLAAA